MSSLLEEVLAAHGGLDEFAKVRGITAEMSFGGPFWGNRGWPGVLDRATVTLDTTREHLAFEPFPSTGSRSVYDVDHSGAETLRFIGADGSVIDERTDPRSTFPVYDPTVPWDAMQTCYFASVASWNYLMEPFLFARPDVRTAEIEPWREDGQTWRRLAVTFPASLPNHNPDQVFYFDDRFLLRRMDYHPEVTDSRIAHYTDEPKEFDGFVFYTRRRVYPRGLDGQAKRDVAVITVDTASLRVDRGAAPA